MLSTDPAAIRHTVDSYLESSNSRHPTAISRTRHAGNHDNCWASFMLLPTSSSAITHWPWPALKVRRS